QPACHRGQQAQSYPQGRVTSQQIAGPAKPRQECRQRSQVKRRNACARLCIGSGAGRKLWSLRLVCSARGVRGSMCRRKMHCACVPVEMWQMEVAGARASQKKRKKAEAEADRETDQVKV